MEECSMNRSKIANVTLVALLCLPIVGYAATVGQQFRDIMAEVDAQCRKDKQGPYFEPGIPNHDRHSGCDILSIKPADPLVTEEGRFAYSIKLPPPHDKLKAQYFSGMGAETYFKSLCEKDAGEWIFRTVEGVEGVFQGRENIPPYRDSLLVYQKYEASEGRTRELQDVMVQPIYGGYNYLERARDLNEVGKSYVRFFRGAEDKKRFPIGWGVRSKSGKFFDVPYIVNKEQTDMLKSRYGFTWRQISTSDMLENGITGGETIIYDHATGEVLGFRRFFERVWPRSDSKGSRLTNGAGCYPGFTGGVSNFVQKVLVPINPAE